jgi:hypothetical protein
VDVLGAVAQAAIIVYAVFAALTQLGIAVQLTAPMFLIVLGSLALAAAIAFGWGACNVAQDILERTYDRRDEARPDGTGDGGAENPGDGAPTVRRTRRSG